MLREFDWLRTSVTPGDTAMLFIAGHGVNDAQGQYFFMPHDAQQHERLLSTGVPQAAIVSTLAQIRGRTLMFIDTCFAGNALGALHKAPKKTERLINDLSASENGVVVFASSTGQEESLEKESWGNGAFTKALLEGLSGRADFMRAGRITYAALNLFVSEEVSRLTDGRQRPVFISPRGVPDFALARL
ncbi:MAG: caspase family protein [Rubrivivax sp.]